jgi:hypothetical protein
MIDLPDGLPIGRNDVHVLFDIRDVDDLRLQHRRERNAAPSGKLHEVIALGPGHWDKSDAGEEPISLVREQRSTGGIMIFEFPGRLPHR